MLDIILISEALTPELKEMTQRAIDSVHQSTTLEKMVIVVERTQQNYANAIVLHDDLPFNYNRLANFAIRHASADNIIVANNDVRFLSQSPDILCSTRALVVSPVDPNGPVSVQGVEFGTQVGHHFMGWCFLIRRSLWAYLGGFNEDYPFWYADNVVVDQLKEIGVIPAVNGEAKVRHKVSATLRHLPSEQQYQYTTVATHHYRHRNAS